MGQELTLSQHPSGAFDDREDENTTEPTVQDASAMLAHELRNPLTVIRAAIDLLASEGKSNQETLEILRRQTQYMTDLVSDLLDMTRSTHGKMRIHKQPVQLRPLIESVLQSMAKMINSRRQTIETKMSVEPIWIHADPVRMSQILVNLLSNASKYSDTGSTITLVVQQDPMAVEIHVIDQGQGIAAEDLPNIFNFFSQSKMTLDHAQGGLGIGLGLVRNLVQAHGGSVAARSDGPGTGSEFIIRLPRVTAPNPQPRSLSPTYSPRKLRVLLVDDRRDSTYLLRALIQKLGDHTIRSVCDGSAALEAMVDFRPDVIILDLGLPGMCGLELTKRIRLLDRTGDTFLVVLTGFDDDRLRDEVLRAGVDLVHLKPASMDLVREIFSHPRLAVAANR